MTSSNFLVNEPEERCMMPLTKVRKLSRTFGGGVVGNTVDSSSTALEVACAVFLAQQHVSTTKTLAERMGIRGDIADWWLYKFNKKWRNRDYLSCRPHWILILYFLGFSRQSYSIILARLTRGYCSPYRRASKRNAKFRFTGSKPRY